MKSHEQCSIWGVLNVTPDSFSDGGAFFKPEAAITQGLRLIEQGADVVDVGGQSTRPAGKAYGAGYEQLTATQETQRILPVVEALSAQVVVSIDTSQGKVAASAVEAGAKIINDVSGGADPALLEVAAKCPVDLVLMHNRGRGEVNAANTCYKDVTQDVIDELGVCVERALRAGVRRERIWLDPGIGFAKTADQSLRLLNSLEDLLAHGYRVLVGASRKSFITAASAKAADPSHRLGGSLAVALFAAREGVHAVRVHDVFETRQAFDTLSAIRQANRG